MHLTVTLLSLLLLHISTSYSAYLPNPLYERRTTTSTLHPSNALLPRSHLLLHNRRDLPTSIARLALLSKRGSPGSRPKIFTLAPLPPTSFPPPETQIRRLTAVEQRSRQASTLSEWRNTDHDWEAMQRQRFEVQNHYDELNSLRKNSADEFALLNMRRHIQELDSGVAEAGRRMGSLGERFCALDAINSVSWVVVGGGNAPGPGNGNGNGVIIGGGTGAAPGGRGRGMKGLR